VKKVTGTITYDSGQAVPFVAGPAQFAALEAYARRQGFNPTDGRDNATVTLYLAYAALHVQEGFDVWLASVDDVDLADDEEAVEVPPIPSGALGE